MLSFCVSLSLLESPEPVPCSSSQLISDLEKTWHLLVLEETAFHFYAEAKNRSRSNLLLLHPLTVEEKIREDDNTYLVRRWISLFFLSCCIRVIFSPWNYSLFFVVVLGVFCLLFVHLFVWGCMCVPSDCW